MTDVRLRPISQAAKELDTSRSTLWRIIRQNGLQTYRRPFDHRTWVDVDELGRYLKPKPQE